jgi:hypothetical protein
MAAKIGMLMVMVGIYLSWIPSEAFAGLSVGKLVGTCTCSCLVQPFGAAAKPLFLDSQCTKTTISMNGLSQSDCEISNGKNEPCDGYEKEFSVLQGANFPATCRLTQILGTISCVYSRKLSK